MANRKRDIGCEVPGKRDWWHNHRWLVLHHPCQFFMLGMFLNGPWFGVWILHSNYSSSPLFNTIPLTDPLMTLQSLASGHLPATIALTGAVITTVLYALAGKRLFYSWVCPLNPITDLANWLRRRFDLNQPATIPRHTRYVLLVIILVGSALTGTLIWEWVNPVSLMGHSLVVGFGGGALLIPALFLSDLLVVEHGWCGHICPVGALYGVSGSKGVITVAANDQQKYNHCMNCFRVCPEPYVLRAPVSDEQSPVQVTSHDRITCGRCVDVCPEDIPAITTRWSPGAEL